MRVLRMVKHGCSKTEDSPVLQYKTLTVNKAIFFPNVCFAIRFEAVLCYCSICWVSGTKKSM